MDFCIRVLAFFLPLCNSQSYSNVFTAGYSDKIMTYSLADGKLALTQQLTLETNMTYVKIESDFLYSVHEVSEYANFGKSGAISRWKIGQNEKGLPSFTKLQVVSSNGTGPCYLNVDFETGFLHAADYDGSTFTSYHIDRSTGEILQLTLTRNFGNGSDVHPDRQEASHPHGTFTFKDFVYVTDLGADKIWHFKITKGGIVPADPAFTADFPGSGPRHIAIDKSRSLVYIVHELKSLVLIYKIDESSGALFLQGAVDLLENSPIPLEQHTWPFQFAAEIEIHPNGRFLYVSNRGLVPGAMIVYKILENGELQFIQYHPVVSTIPRLFKIHPDGNHLLVALQDSNVLELFSIDQETGMVKKVQEIESNNSPTIVAFF